MMAIYSGSDLIVQRAAFFIIKITASSRSVILGESIILCFDDVRDPCHELYPAKDASIQARLWIAWGLQLQLTK